MNGTYINKAVWDYLRKQNTAIAKKILNKLDYDIANFVRYDDDIHIERTWSGAYIPDYLFFYIKRHQKNIIVSLIKEPQL